MQKRLYRSNDQMIGGVAAGIAEYFDIDPTIARLAWALALLAGVGFVFYMICWVVIPPAPSKSV